MTGLLFTIVFFPLAGLAVARVLGPVSWYLAGVGLTGLVLFALGVARVPLMPSLLVLVCLCALAFFKRRAPAQEHTAAAPPPTIVMSVVAVAILIVTAIVPLNDYDGRLFWLLKAKAIAHEGAIGGPFFQTVDPNPAYYALRPPPNSHNRYPLLMPLNAATVFVVTRELDERHVRWLYALIPIAFAFEIRRRVGGWFGALFLLLPAVALDRSGGAMTAYSDLALAAFVGCAVFELADGESPLRTGFWIACALVTKDEGLIFGVVLLAIAMVVFRRRVRAALPLVAVAAATLAAWRAMVPLTDWEHAAGSLVLLPERLGGLRDAAVQFVRYAAAWSEWGVFWPGVFIAMLALAYRRQWRLLAIATSVIVPVLCVYTTACAVNPWTLEELMKVSATRLLLHLTGPGILLIAAASQGSASGVTGRSREMSILDVSGGRI